ncbi:hypothetical protein UCRPC4_g04248 [Phaeomoniella chlamydospora]|uniref:Myb-like DNA-binding domain-containing protein n=1 Tax=Phaeomoniella chlamydospora TaxID=158046 RepID=A0A0G2EC86_PHACM|nr:hypothetical protein UCRPC4_g04248 [Phaeomoniella chlamydospora]
MAPKANPEKAEADQATLLLSVIKNTEGVTNWNTVAQECGISTGSAVQKRIKRLRDKYPSETDGGAPTSTNGDDAQDAKPEAAKTPTKAKTPRTPRKKAAEKKSGKESPTKKRKVKEESADEAETKEEDGSDEQGSDEAE